MAAWENNKITQVNATKSEVFDEAEENGWEPIADAYMNGDPVRKPIEPGTELNYDRMAVLWDE